MKTPILNDKAKSILKSKTFWIQVVSFASVFFPPVRAFLAANPVEFVGVLAGVNTVVRFATKGKVTLFSDATGGNGAGKLNLLLALCTAATLMGALPSCTTVTAPDGTVTQAPHTETIQEGTGFLHWLYDVFTIERDRASEPEPGVAVEVNPAK